MSLRSSPARLRMPSFWYSKRTVKSPCFTALRTSTNCSTSSRLSGERRSHSVIGTNPVDPLSLTALPFCRFRREPPSFLFRRASVFDRPPRGGIAPSSDPLDGFLLRREGTGEVPGAVGICSWLIFDRLLLQIWNPRAHPFGRKFSVVGHSNVYFFPDTHGDGCPHAFNMPKEERG